MEIPEFVEKKLEEISTRTTISLEQVKKDYEKFFNSDFIKDDEQFTSDEDRHKYAKGVFWTRYILRKPVNPYNIIPIGVDSIRRSKATGIENTSIFALDDKLKLRRISLKGDVCAEVKKLTFWSMYKGVNLGSFKDGSDLVADDRAEFNHPVQVNMTPIQIFEQLGIEETTIEDVEKHLSKVGSDGYTVKTDWKAIRGFIQRPPNKSKPDAESEWGVYTIADETLDPNEMEMEVSPSGEILPPGFSVWISPTLMNYGRESKCIFLGTITKSKPTKEQLNKNPDMKPKVSMNAYCVIPLYVHLIEEE